MSSDCCLPGHVRWTKLATVTQWGFQPMMVTINIWRGSGIVRFGVSPEFKDQPDYLQNQMTLYVSSHIQTRAGEIALGRGICPALTIRVQFPDLTKWWERTSSRGLFSDLQLWAWHTHSQIHAISAPLRNPNSYSPPAHFLDFVSTAHQGLTGPWTQ